jgi:hypothetical protein
MTVDYHGTNSQNQGAGGAEAPYTGSHTEGPGFNPTDYVGASQQNDDLSPDYLGVNKQEDEDNAYVGINKKEDEEKDEDGLAKMLKNKEKDDTDEEKDREEKQVKDEDIFADAPTAKGKSTLDDMFKSAVKANTKLKAPKSKPTVVEETNTKNITNTTIVTKKPVASATEWKKRPVNVRRTGNIQEVKKRAWEREY